MARPAKPLKLQHASSENIFFTSQSLTFPHRISIITSLFWGEPLLVTTFRCRIMILCANGWFGDHFKSDGGKMAPQICQGASKWHPFLKGVPFQNQLLPKTLWKRTAAQYTPETHQGVFFDDICTLPGLIWNDFQRLLTPLIAFNSHVRYFLFFFWQVLKKAFKFNR